MHFASLPAGTYPVHLHSRCSGSAPFHLAVIGTLTIDGGGQGSITVPNPDFDHGWCLIVYRSPSLQSVLTTRAI